MSKNPVKSNTFAKNNEISFIVVDLFCGAGGATTGLADSGKCVVVAAVNHDEYAIASHSANHANTAHFNEDVRAYDMLAKLACIVDDARTKYPFAKVVLWASMECTNFSNAKGGKPREQDSRTLANVLFWYVEAIAPEYVWYENVREFLAWGPLDDAGKPVHRTKGTDYLRWVQVFAEYGYAHTNRILNAADYGARTSRLRLFGVFALKGLPIAFPEATHAKNPDKSGVLYGKTLQPWLPVRDLLDLKTIGKSVFSGEKSDKTLIRITKGIEKFGEDFVMSYFGEPDTNARVKSLSEPAPTITAQPRQNLVQLSAFIHSYYTSGDSVSPLSAPAPTVPAMEVHSLIHCRFIVNPQYASNGHSINAPAPTVIAAQKSFPLSLATAVSADNTDLCSNWTATDTDSDAMRSLRKICRDKGIADVYLRMLSVTELKRIQGFNDDYQLQGSTAAQKKQLGNAVHPIIAKLMALAMSEKL